LPDPFKILDQCWEKAKQYRQWNQQYVGYVDFLQSRHPFAISRAADCEDCCHDRGQQPPITDRKEIKDEYPQMITLGKQSLVRPSQKQKQ